jgi:hypothetical protein
MYLRLYDFRYRTYGPTLGRFLQRDLLPSDDYVSFRALPQSLSDPLGLHPGPLPAKGKNLEWHRDIDSTSSLYVVDNITVTSMTFKRLGRPCCNGTVDDATKYFYSMEGRYSYTLNKRTWEDYSWYQWQGFDSLVDALVAVNDEIDQLQLEQAERGETMERVLGGGATAAEVGGEVASHKGVKGGGLSGIAAAEIAREIGRNFGRMEKGFVQKRIDAKRIKRQEAIDRVRRGGPAGGVWVRMSTGTILLSDVEVGRYSGSFWRLCGCLTATEAEAQRPALTQMVIDYARDVGREKARKLNQQNQQ